MAFLEQLSAKFQELKPQLNSVVEQANKAKQNLVPVFNKCTQQLDTIGKILQVSHNQFFQPTWCESKKTLPLIEPGMHKGGNGSETARKARAGPRLGPGRGIWVRVWMARNGPSEYLNFRFIFPHKQRYLRNKKYSTCNFNFSNIFTINIFLFSFFAKKARKARAGPGKRGPIFILRYAWPSQGREGMKLRSHERPPFFIYKYPTLLLNSIESMLLLDIGQVIGE